MGRFSDRRAASHDRRVRDLLLSLFSPANDVYSGNEGATERAVEIYNPNLCLHRTTTPSDFWKAFSSGSAEDGLLPRFLIFETPPGPLEIVEPKLDAAEVPMALVKRLRT